MRSTGTGLFVLIMLFVLIGKMPRDNRPKPPVEPNLPAIMKDLAEIGKRHDEIVRNLEENSRRVIMDMNQQAFQDHPE